MRVWYLDSQWEKRSNPCYDFAKKKKIPLVQSVPDTVTKEQENILLYFHYAEDRSLLCGFWSLLGFDLIFFKLVFLCGFHFHPGWVRRKGPVAEEPRALVDVSASHWPTAAHSRVEVQLWQVECSEWSLIRLPLLIFSSLQLSSRKIVTSKSKQRGKRRVWETRDFGILWHFLSPQWRWVW